MPTFTPAALAAQVLQRIHALGQITDEPGCLTRTYGSPAMRQVNDLVSLWMSEAGMNPRLDAIGNVLGRYDATEPDAKTFLLGSHLDTVRDAGRFDGPLGVLVALACVQHLHSVGRRLPFHVEVAGFADEEGVRFHCTYLGSRTVAGTLTADDFARKDADGVSLREAILLFGGDPAGLHGAQIPGDQLLGYAEVHIEQGPVLDSLQVPIGIAPSIAGQTRLGISFTGQAAHAGTTPMDARRDALAGAASFVSAVEALALQGDGLMATVGRLQVEPNVSNVIPSRVTLSLDVRHAADAARQAAAKALRETAGQIASQRRLRLTWDLVQETPSIGCAPEWMALLREAARRHVPNPPELPSGAGHDAVALSAITPVAMLLVRCKDGVSHHPDESAREDDIAVAIAVMIDFLEQVAKQ